MLDACSPGCRRRASRCIGASCNVSTATGPSHAQRCDCPGTLVTVPRTKRRDQRAQPTSGSMCRAPRLSSVHVACIGVASGIHRLLAASIGLQALGGGGGRMPGAPRARRSTDTTIVLRISVPRDTTAACEASDVREQRSSREAPLALRVPSPKPPSLDVPTSIAFTSTFLTAFVTRSLVDLPDAPPQHRHRSGYNGVVLPIWAAKACTRVKSPPQVL